jgi:hypothetical protein
LDDVERARRAFRHVYVAVDGQQQKQAEPQNDRNAGAQDQVSRLDVIGLRGGAFCGVGEAGAGALQT